MEKPRPTETSKIQLIQGLRKALEQRTTSGAKTKGRCSTGYELLDERTGGGFFIGALNEIHVSEAGSGAMEIFLRGVMSSLAAVDQRLWIWIHPFATPYPPALAQAGGDLARWLILQPPTADDHLWALEQSLRSGAASLVISHMGSANDTVLRRLQVAALEGGVVGLLFRPWSVLSLDSPAALRLGVSPAAGGSPRSRRLTVTIRRCRGLVMPSSFDLEWTRDPLAESLAASSLGRTPATSTSPTGAFSANHPPEATGHSRRAFA